MATEKKNYVAADTVKALQNTGMSERHAILVSMKQSKKEQKRDSPMTAGTEKDPYPYGLALSLEDGSLTKLGITTLPEVGSTVHLHGKATVESVSKSNSTEGGTRRSVCLQITDLCLEDAADEADESTADDEDAGA